ncbi:MAG: dipeptidase [Terrimicrobiaceae bacterium]|nr:dipeptidase [Terrimicrobiaceae bacterium]
MNDPRLDELFEFLRFPSVSAQSNHRNDVWACADWVAAKLQKIGLETKIALTPGNPVVLGRTPHDPAKRTVLIYGHYDVQPPEPLELWTTPPFEPEIRDGRIFARGSTDNKGQIFAHILGVEESLKTGPLPVNVIFLIEGEEEVGSDNLENFLMAQRENLACDFIAISDTGMAADGYPTLSYALRGIAAMEVKVHGPSHDLHSGVYGGAVANPATAAARLVASLHHADGRVAIPGFYDDVRDLADWEREAAAAAPVTDADIAEQAGVEELFGEPGYNALERIGARPTAEVNGIGGGYQGEGSKTVLPAEAFFKLTFRLVPNQDPARILKLAEDHLRKNCPPGVKMTIEGGHAGAPFFADPNSTGGLAAQRALQEVFGKKPALLREGGSIPILGAFQRILGRDALLVALASPDCRAHSPDENFPLANFFAGIRLNQVLLRELAK